MRRTTALFCFILAAVLGGAAAAGTPVWLAATGGPATFDLGDVDRAIWSANEILDPLAIEDVTGGQAWGASLTFELGPRLSVGAGYERLSAEAGLKTPDGEVDWNLAANAFRGFLEYRAPARSGLSIGLGAGIGLVHADGDLYVDHPELGDENGVLGGDGLLAEFYYLMDADLGGDLALGLMLGYRSAKIEEAEFDGEQAFNEDGSRFGLDYSGLIARCALKLRIF